MHNWIVRHYPLLASTHYLIHIRVTITNNSLFTTSLLILWLEYYAMEDGTQIKLHHMMDHWLWVASLIRQWRSVHSGQKAILSLIGFHQVWDMSKVGQPAKTWNSETSYSLPIIPFCIKMLPMLKTCIFCILVWAKIMDDILLWKRKLVHVWQSFCKILLCQLQYIIFNSALTVYYVLQFSTTCYCFQILLRTSGIILAIKYF